MQPVQPVQQLLIRDGVEATPIVCVGLSSGAVLPLLAIFSKLNPKTGMAFVVIHHVHSVHTLLPHILARCTTMPVHLACEGLIIEANHVYVLPSGTELTLSDGTFVLHPRSKVTGWTNVITVFLNSLSRSCHTGIAVILSGFDKDGAAALKTFKEVGGTTIVQAPLTAEEPGMPLAAIETGYVDYVLVPEKIAPQLEEIAERFKRSQTSRAAEAQHVADSAD
jgi:two-component system, chemotaxis family, protein-glutamate methylesterase/glutaminase